MLTYTLVLTQVLAAVCTNDRSTTTTTNYRPYMTAPALMPSLQPVHILSPTPFSGGWAAGSVFRVAAEIAMDIINSDQLILPGLKLVSAWFDDEGNSDYTMALVLDNLLKRNASWIGVGGTGNSGVCGRLGQFLPKFRKPQVSYGCASISLSDPIKYPGMVRMNTVESGMVAVLETMAHVYKWTDITMFQGNILRYGTLETQFLDHFKDKLSITLELPREPSFEDLYNAMVKLRRARRRIIILLGYQEFMLSALCAAYKAGMPDGVVWLSMGTYDLIEPDTLSAFTQKQQECDAASILRYAEGFLFVGFTGKPPPRNMDDPLDCLPNFTSRSFRDVLVNHFEIGYPVGENMAPNWRAFANAIANGADGICVWAYLVKHMIGLNFTVEELEKPDLAIYEEMVRYIREDLRFVGAMGLIDFEGTDLPGQFALYQIQNASFDAGDAFAVVDDANIIPIGNHKLMWGDGSINPGSFFPACPFKTLYVDGACKPCVIGEFFDVALLECIPCSMGKFSDEIGAIDCSLCAPGSSQNRPGSTHCNPCSLGEFVNAFGATLCNSCSEGYFAALNGSSKCDPCTRGRYVSVEKATACVSCALGLTTSFDGAGSNRSCSPCPAGEVTKIGSSICTQCVGGRAPDTSKQSCTFCAAGRYSNGGDSMCTLCEAGHTSTQDSRECTICALGRYARLGDAVCSHCEDGKEPSLTRDYCIPCRPGWRASAGDERCAPCESGRVPDEIQKACQFCDGMFFRVKGMGTSCEPDIQVLLACLGAAIAFGYAFGTVPANLGARRTGKLAITLSGRWHPIDDMWTEEGHVVLRTADAYHGLRQRCLSSFPVLLIGTGNIMLDGKRLRARVRGPRTLILLDQKGSALSEFYELSQGFIALHFSHALVHQGWPLPLGAGIPLLLGLGLWILYLFKAVPKEAAVSLILGILRALLNLLFAIKFPVRSRIHIVADTFLEGLPEPVATNPGHGRAINIAKLQSLQQQFNEFIRERDMHYIEPNIVRPLTARWKLSLADVLGASHVLWFVSHWWGNPFQHTMEALERHSDALARIQTGLESTRSSAVELVLARKKKTIQSAHNYWICTFSNNQWKLDEEIPGSLEDSSFFKTLLSGFCEGVCLILDELATPLTRSWCLFEYLHGVHLIESRRFDNFQGVLFCHQSGVLNYGSASAEVSLALGSVLGDLRLEDATATRLEDKVMIDELVVLKMDSFENINLKLRLDIEGVVKASRRKTDAKFAQLSFNLEAKVTRSKTEILEKEEEEEAEHRLNVLSL